MKGMLRYTTLAQRYTSRFPMLSYLAIQVNFWIVANLVLMTVMHFVSVVISHNYKIPAAGSFGSMLITGLVFGTIQGFPLGLMGYYLDRRMFRMFSLGRVIVLKVLASLFLLVAILV